LQFRDGGKSLQMAAIIIKDSVLRELSETTTIGVAGRCDTRIASDASELVARKNTASGDVSS